MTKRNKGLDLNTVLTIEADHPRRLFPEQRLAFVSIPGHLSAMLSATLYGSMLPVPLTGSESMRGLQR